MCIQWEWVMKPGEQVSGGSKANVEIGQREICMN